MSSSNYAFPRESHKKIKSCYIIPQEEHDNALEVPLRTTPTAMARRNRAAMLASSRIERDALMRKMENLILKEAELASAYELFDYTRKKCAQEHADIVSKLEQYEELLRDIQQKEAVMRHEAELVLSSDQERERWQHIKTMVHSILPELLARLEDTIEVNAIKIRSIQDKIEEIRAYRLALREEIAVKEEDIAFALQ